jgi:nucleotide-binding universal stress UspA family protein
VSIKSLLVSIDMSETGRERMQYAFDLAEQHAAHLVGYYASPTVGMDVEGSPQDIAEAVHQEFDRQLGLRHLTGAWVLGDKPLAADVAEQIRYCDLALIGLGSPDDIGPDPQGFRIEEIVRSCGRPILGLPISRLAPPPFSRVLVAWDGSPQASRALHDALPLLKGGETIYIVSLGGDGAAKAERLIAHLARHGLAATFYTMPSFEMTVGDELLQRAALLEVDLVVAGAYGHSRLGEDLFGGASNTLVHQMLVPILVSH